MTEHDRELGGLNLAIAEVQVRSADAARAHLQQQLARARHRIGHRRHPQGLAGCA
jgi:hypothetical protein